MGDFIAKRWTYIDDAAVWTHAPGASVTGPNYMNVLYTPDEAASATGFDYLSADGDPLQAFVTAFPEP